MCLPLVSLLLNIGLLSQVGVELEHGALQSDNGLLAVSQAPLQFIDLSFVVLSLLVHLGR